MMRKATALITKQTPPPSTQKTVCYYKDEESYIIDYEASLVYYSISEDFLLTFKCNQ